MALSLSIVDNAFNGIFYLNILSMLIKFIFEKLFSE